MEYSNRSKTNWEDFIYLLKEWKKFFDNDKEYKEWINKNCELYDPTPEQIEIIKKEIINKLEYS